MKSFVLSFLAGFVMSLAACETIPVPSEQEEKQEDRKQTEDNKQQLVIYPAWKSGRKNCRRVESHLRHRDSFRHVLAETIKGTVFSRKLTLLAN